MEPGARTVLLRCLLLVIFVGASVVASASAVSAVEAHKAQSGVALKVTGTADCSGSAKPGEEIALGVTVTGGHKVCVTHQDATWNFFFDGRLGGSSFGPTSSFTGGVGTIGRRLVLLAGVSSPTTALKLTFCNGMTLMLRPLNNAGPQYFFAAAIDDQKYGIPATEPVISPGSLMTAKDARELACQRFAVPPSTTRKSR